MAWTTLKKITSLDLLLAFVTLPSSPNSSSAFRMVPGPGCGTTNPIRHEPGLGNLGDPDNLEALRCAVFERRTDFDAVMKAIEVAKCRADVTLCKRLRCKFLDGITKEFQLVVPCMRVEEKASLQYGTSRFFNKKLFGRRN